MAPWIMPLFMMLAGTSAWYSLRRRSNVEYVRDRVTRILIPLIIGILVLVPPQVYAERRLLTWYLVHQTMIILLAVWVVMWGTGVEARAVTLLLLSLAGTVLVIVLVHTATPLLRRARAVGASST